MRAGKLSRNVKLVRLSKEKRTINNIRGSIDHGLSAVRFVDQIGAARLNVRIPYVLGRILSEIGKFAVKYTVRPKLLGQTRSAIGHENKTSPPPRTF